MTTNQLAGFNYDAAGNMTGNGSATYQYNQEDQLTKFITTTTDTYLYDGDGQRVKKNIRAVTLYWYDTSGNVTDETTGNGTLVAEYVHFSGKRVATTRMAMLRRRMFKESRRTGSLRRQKSGMQIQTTLIAL